MAPNIPLVKLNNGTSIPLLGLGTWKSKPNEVAEAVKYAIEVGFRHIDCAYAYENEHEVGQALKAKMEDGTIKREDVFITSKVWNTHHSRHLVFESFNATLKDLGVSYVDMYMVHWPVGFQEGGELYPKDKDGKFLFSDVDYMETWLAVEEIYKKGLAKAIGLANFNKEQIERVISQGTVIPSNLQIECHPYFTQKKMIQYCRSKGIAVTAYSPLGSPDRPFAKPDDPKLMENPVIIGIGKKYNKSAAQIMIKFQIQRGVVVIPKSTIEKEIRENIQIFDFEISPEDMTAIENLDCNCKFLHHTWLKDHKYFPFHAEF